MGLSEDAANLAHFNKNGDENIENIAVAFCGKNMKLVASEAQFSEVLGARILVFINHLIFWQLCLLI